MTHNSCYYEEGHPLKKHLLSTSALALGVAFAAPATAQEWDVSFGGYMNQHVGFADISGSAIAPGTDFDGVNIHSTSEIHFTPSITLDNGLTFGVNVQLEGENAGGQIDETYATISGDTLGRIVIGSENSAGYTMMVGAPGVVSMYINSPSISTYIPFSAAYPGGFRQAGLSSNTEVAGNNDVQRLTYYTPSFNGLTIGVSYAPTGAVNAANSGAINKNGTLSDIFDIGMKYSQTFGTTSVTVAARYGTGTAPTGFVGSDPETWGVGAQFGFADFTVGGSYAVNDNGVAGGAGDSEGWSLGVTYDMAGPWSFEAQTYQGSTDIGATDADYEAYQIGASRDLGPGVSWDIYAAQVNADDGVPGVAGLDVDGFVIGTGINLSF
ncbi:porin [Rhodobacteraceae bacterium KMM 6894]|nr:porin [Rhodobacteraceae bacterium KMM 6894]